MYADQWNEARTRPVEKMVHSFPDGFEGGQADSGFIRNVSKKRSQFSSKFFDSFEGKTDSNKAKMAKSYYYETDDVLFDDVASDVTLLRWSERLREIPMDSSSGSEKRDGLKRRFGNPPMPVTYYDRDKGPFTVI